MTSKAKVGTVFFKTYKILWQGLGRRPGPMELLEWHKRSSNRKIYAKSSMWKNIIKLQKFYPHEYRFSNFSTFSSLRPSRERPEIFHTTSDRVPNWRYWVNYTQLLLFWYQKHARTWWGVTLSPRTLGSQFVAKSAFWMILKINVFSWI